MQASASSAQHQGGSIPFFANRQQQRQTPTASAADTTPTSLSRSTGSVFDGHGEGNGSSSAPSEKSTVSSTPRTEAVSPRSSGSSAPFSTEGTRRRPDDSRSDRRLSSSSPSSLPSPNSRPSAEESPADRNNSGNKRRMLLDADVRCAEGKCLRSFAYFPSHRLHVCAFRRVHSGPRRRMHFGSVSRTQNAGRVPCI